MPNNLDIYNEHILQTDSKSNSFIANVNFLARKFENLIQIDNKFNEESVKLLSQLVQNALDIQIKVLADDLRKGTHYGYRKLDINLLTNFIDYDYYASEEAKNKLWNDPTKQVYYNKARVYFAEDNDNYVEKEFKTRINSHHELYHELVSWPELAERYGYTNIETSEDTDLANHELLRITDNYYTDVDLSANFGSRINRVVLYVAQDIDLNAGLAGAKSNAPVFTWTDTTSSLITIANKITDIISSAEYLKDVGQNFVENMQKSVEEVTRLRDEVLQMQSDTQAYADAILARANVTVDSIVAETQSYVQQAQDFAQQAEATVNRQQALRVTGKVIDADALPTVIYNGDTNLMTFGLPRSEVAIVGLSNFKVDTDTGHLVFSIRSADDINKAYINEAGRIVLELNN